MITLEDIIDYAKQQGWDGAIYIGKWKDFDVYITTINRGRIIGHPCYYLVKYDEIKFIHYDNGDEIRRYFAKELNDIAKHLRE